MSLASNRMTSHGTSLRLPRLSTGSPFGEMLSIVWDGLIDLSPDRGKLGLEVFYQGRPRHWKSHLLAVLGDQRLADLTFHDLRHDFAHRAREAGWSLEEVAYYLGHVTKKGTPAIQTTVHYTQVSREQVKEKLKQVKR